MLCQSKGMGDTSSSAGSVRSDGGSSVDSPMGCVADVAVSRDVLLTMNEYVIGLDNLVLSGELWEKANRYITTTGSSESIYLLLSVFCFSLQYPCQLSLAIPPWLATMSNSTPHTA